MVRASRRGGVPVFSRPNRNLPSVESRGRLGQRSDRWAFSEGRWHFYRGKVGLHREKWRFRFEAHPSRPRVRARGSSQGKGGVSQGEGGVLGLRHTRAGPGCARVRWRQSPRLNPTCRSQTANKSIS
eukprot:1195588-Prorocentrum_minimum.AAC.15